MLFRFSPSCSGSLRLVFLFLAGSAMEAVAITTAEVGLRLKVTPSRMKLYKGTWALVSLQGLILALSFI